MGFRVGDNYRTNPLSHQPGGEVVCAREENGRVLEYDKVKQVWPYIRAIKANNPAIQCWWYKNTPQKTYKI